MPTLFEERPKVLEDARQDKEQKVNVQKENQQNELQQNHNEPNRNEHKRVTPEVKAVLHSEEKPLVLSEIKMEQQIAPLLQHENEVPFEVSRQSVEENKISIYEYCRQVPTAQESTTCGEAATMLNDGQEHPCIVLCDEQMKPTGLMMRENLYRLLNGRFAADLFYRKPIINTANTSPVIVDIHMEPAAIIDAALRRDEEHFYDCLLVTEHGRLLGVLTMRDVMLLSRKLQQAASADRIRTVMESGREIARIHEAVTKLVQAANQTVQEAGQIIALSNEGEGRLRQVETSYSQVHEHMGMQGNHASQMLESIEASAGMARSIRTLADQSGLLALNASIEAAHAGEYGRGFQIVAGEIRALAKQTREVAEKMSSLLMGIESLTEQTVSLIQANGAEIDGSAVYVQEGAAAFGKLNAAVHALSCIVENIANEGGQAGQVAEHIQTKLKSMLADHAEL
ncbi:CBS domain-containing protein [Paenibacillus barcinonensis]|uniref:CBS domain-containing protein n=1 Tax=Paenibacillus barcinonensis TaxID=198119 RepID=A0A2V4WA78_PAEBA|nr:methyl-accepting chemotaxis protein [Paenibacillus barcinonensis]PYE52461.1 methyl-accepting chemotaxis protein [Paenibacillus barcinonensis]QKS59431.1 CBS domain-containing protein [Paenibacillus barcinonensis]